jgi:SAM-dependent methyltransferase
MDMDPTSPDQSILWNDWADTYDDWNRHLDPAPAVRFLLGIEPAGLALELGVGTGRVALELARAGRPVDGIEIAPKMVAQLEHKRGDLPVRVYIGDMADVPVDGPYPLVYAAYSSLFSLTDQASQVRCFRSVARVLAPDGAFVLECSIPWPGLLSPSKGINLHDFEGDMVRISASISDLANQRISFRELVFDGRGMRVLPVEQRYCWPAELDLMAQLAGLALTERYSNFDRDPFTRATLRHVSVYRRSS